VSPDSLRGALARCRPTALACAAGAFVGGECAGEVDDASSNESARAECARGGPESPRTYGAGGAEPGRAEGGGGTERAKVSGRASGGDEARARVCCRPFEFARCASGEMETTSATEGRGQPGGAQGGGGFANASAFRAARSAAFERARGDAFAEG
jgi:hypothetical protein